MANNMFYIITMLAVVLWIYTIVDVFKFKGLIKRKKIIWFVLILIFPIISSLIYLMFTKKRELNREFKPKFN